MEYELGTELVLNPGPFSCGYVSGRALCSDGVVRRLRFANGGIPDTLFSIPARVHVGKRTVSGFASVDGTVVTFTAYRYGKNADALPSRGSTMEW